jgi:hypothetical protein
MPRQQHGLSHTLCFFPAQALPSTVFVCHDADGAPLVCLHIAQQRSLAALRVCCDGDAGAPASAELRFVTPAAAAVPLVASRSARASRAAPRDLLLLSPAGTLSLHVGATHLCDCALPPPAAAESAAATPRRTPKHTPARAAAATPGSGSDDCDMDLEDAPTPEPHTAAAAAHASPLPAAPQPSGGDARAPLAGLCDPCGARATALLADGTALRCARSLACLFAC